LSGRQWAGRFCSPGGPRSRKERDERIDAKLDRLLEDRSLDPDDVTRTVNEAR